MQMTLCSWQKTSVTKSRANQKDLESLEGGTVNKLESKYFNTAVKMDEAFLALLDKKDFSYITIKEICELSGVNRSTFYLHYESISDLLLETVEYVNKKFYSYFDHLDMNGRKMKTAQKEDLIFITPEFLAPWLTFIEENKRLYSTIFKRFEAVPIGSELFHTVSETMNIVFERFNVPMKNRKYMMMFYLEGINAIVKEWVKNGCDDSIEEIIQVIEECVRPL